MRHLSHFSNVQNPHYLPLPLLASRFGFQVSPLRLPGRALEGPHECRQSPNWAAHGEQAHLVDRPGGAWAHTVLIIDESMASGVIV